MTENKGYISEPIMVFESGKNGEKSQEGVASYRIPSLLMTKKGTLIAGIDQRHDHQWDWGNIDMVVRRSEDGGKTWGDIIKLVNLQTNNKAEHPDYGSAMNIDMVLVQDETTERIFSIYGMYPEMRGLFGMMEDNQKLVEEGKEPVTEAQHTKIDGKAYLNLYTELDDVPHTVREDGQVFTANGEKTDYIVVLDSKEAPYSDLGDIYQNGEKIGNVFFVTNSNSPFRVAKEMFLWLSYSDDDGKTWSCPRDITAEVKLPWMKFYGIGPGVGLTLQTGPHKGRLIAPTYSTHHPYRLNGSQSSRVIYSDDHGETWTSGAAVNDNRVLANGQVLHSSSMDVMKEQNTEASALQLKSGAVLLFMRNLSGSVISARSTDGGVTWNNDLTVHEDINDVYCQMAAIQTVQDGVEYVLLTNAEGPKRFNGVVHVAKVEKDDRLTWINKKPLQEGKYAYNAIQQINSENFGVLYEHSDEDYNEYCAIFKFFHWNYLFEK